MYYKENHMTINKTNAEIAAMFNHSVAAVEQNRATYDKVIAESKIPAGTMCLPDGDVAVYRQSIGIVSNAVLLDSILGRY
jgi:hypothetical protein